MAHILVAEDEEDLRGLVQRALREAGHTVAAVADGAEALGRLEQASTPFDLLLADIRLPVLDGIALALAGTPGQPARRSLRMAGYADQRERAHGLESLSDGVRAKPFTMAELLAAVDTALRRGAGAH